MTNFTAVQLIVLGLTPSAYAPHRGTQVGVLMLTVHVLWLTCAHLCLSTWLGRRIGTAQQLFQVSPRSLTQDVYGTHSEYAVADQILTVCSMHQPFSRDIAFGKGTA